MPTELPGIATPGKIIAVHLNYPSRAAQRGRTPAQPSYFLKPSSSLAASMGFLGQQDHPEVVDAVLHAIRVGAELGKPVGVNAFAPDAADRYLAAGAAFVLVGADVALLARASEALADRFIGDTGSTPAEY